MYEWSIVTSLLVAALAITGAPLLVVLARRRGVDVRRRWGRWFLAGSLFFLYGLDAMAHRARDSGLVFFENRSVARSADGNMGASRRARRRNEG